jgi:hypothetical protein
MGGLPVRGPETSNIPHSNSGKGEGGDLFIEDSIVVTVAPYRKSCSLMGDAEITHRYLLRELK